MEDKWLFSNRRSVQTTDDDILMYPKYTQMWTLSGIKKECPDQRGVLIVGVKQYMHWDKTKCRGTTLTAHSYCYPHRLTVCLGEYVGQVRMSYVVVVISEGLDDTLHPCLPVPLQQGQDMKHLVGPRLSHLGLQQAFRVAAVDQASRAEVGDEGVQIGVHLEVGSEGGQRFEVGSEGGQRLLVVRVWRRLVLFLTAIPITRVAVTYREVNKRSVLCGLSWGARIAPWELHSVENYHGNQMEMGIKWSKSIAIETWCQKGQALYTLHNNRWTPAGGDKYRLVDNLLNK